MIDRVGGSAVTIFLSRWNAFGGEGAPSRPRRTPAARGPIRDATMHGGVRENCAKEAFGEARDVRVTAEDYSPCDPSQAPYSTPNLSTGDGTEAFFTYDAYGELLSQSDRAQHSIYKYDPRGRMTQQQRQIAVPGGSDALASRYAPWTYTKGFISYSEANRLLVSTTGTDLPDLAVNGSSLVTATYAIQGTLAGVTSSYGTLLASQATNGVGKVTSQTFGDAAQTSATMGYDWNYAPTQYVVWRTPGSAGGKWASYAQDVPAAPNQSTYQSVLAHLVVTRDKMGNPTEQNQLVDIEGVPVQGQDTPLAPAIDPSEWPAGAAEVGDRLLSYGDDYRLQEVGTQYDVVTSVKRDDFVSPYVAADGNAYPAPESVSTASRVEDQRYVYDGRGNITHSSDDANVFFDRSLGAIVQSTGDRLTSASFDPTVLTDTGALATTYDGAGNLTAVDIHNGSSYAYAWDELGRLAIATRTDVDGTQIMQNYTYDAKGQRVDTAKSNGRSAPAVHTLQVFDSLVLKNAAFPDAGGKDYQHDDTTESLYLGAGGQAFGRAFYAETPLPSASAGQVHVFMPTADPLGSTAFVIDHDTGEVVEAVSYLPYGGVDSDYRPARWDYAREDVRYAGHWDNAEVGLVYMNARYYSPQLNRFISP